MTLRRIVPIMLAVLSGCAGGPGRELELEERWRPLRSVVEVSDLQARHRYTTIGEHVYVRSLRDFDEHLPPGSVEREALLLHEQVHARRQLEHGLPEWLSRYATDPAFAWREERLGWEAELRHLRAHGRPIVLEAVVRALLRYRTVVTRLPLADETEVRTWAAGVLR